MAQARTTIAITGASQGVGAALAARLSNPETNLILIARNEEKLQSVAATLPGPAQVVAADLCTDAGLETTKQAIQGAGQSLHAVIHAAGIASSHKAEDFDLAAAERMMRLNVFAFQELVAAALPSMKAQKSGRLLAIASVAGLRGYPYISTYAASKHALIGAVRSLAAELGRYGLCVNAICPGYLDTPMTANTLANIAAKTGEGEAAARQSLEAMSPQNRLFTVEEVAASAAFLLSQDARGINGQALAICGGELT